METCLVQSEMKDRIFDRTDQIFRSPQKNDFAFSCFRKNILEFDEQDTPLIYRYLELEEERKTMLIMRKKEGYFFSFPTFKLKRRVFLFTSFNPRLFLKRILAHYRYMIADRLRESSFPRQFQPRIQKFIQNTSTPPLPSRIISPIRLGSLIRSSFRKFAKLYPNQRILGVFPHEPSPFSAYRFLVVSPEKIETTAKHLIRSQQTLETFEVFEFFDELGGLPWFIEQRSDQQTLVF